MLNMKLEILFFLTLCAIFNNQYNFAKALVGPNVRSAEENEFPFVVSIMTISNSTHTQVELFHRCTGTLISKQDVLTAEHCLHIVITRAFKVMIGSSDLALSSPYYPLFCLSHDYWALNNNVILEYTENDLSFVKIIGGIPDHIPFAPTVIVPSNELYGLDVVTAGWGKLQNNTVPKILQTVALKVLTKSECERKMSENAIHWIYVHLKRICTVGNPYAQLNSGDSGGPLLFSGRLIAINCGVSPCYDGVIRPYQVNVHLNLHGYLGYIQDVIENYRINFEI